MADEIGGKFARHSVLTTFTSPLLLSLLSGHWVTARCFTDLPSCPIAYERTCGLIHVCIRSEGSPRRECRRAITRQPKARTLARADAAVESSRTYAGGKPASSLSSCVDAPSNSRVTSNEDACVTRGNTADSLLSAFRCSPSSLQDNSFDRPPLSLSLSPLSLPLSRWPVGRRAASRSRGEPARETEKGNNAPFGCSLPRISRARRDSTYARADRNVSVYASTTPRVAAADQLILTAVGEFRARTHLSRPSLRRREFSSPFRGAILAADRRRYLRARRAHAPSRVTNAAST